MLEYRLVVVAGFIFRNKDGLKYDGRPKRASRRPAELMECRYVSHCCKLTADVRFLIAIPNHPSVKHG